MWHRDRRLVLVPRYNTWLWSQNATLGYDAEILLLVRDTMLSSGAKIMARGSGAEIWRLALVLRYNAWPHIKHPSAVGICEKLVDSATVLTEL